MYRFTRQFVVALMLALYGSVSLCAYGLHALPGFAHHGCYNPKTQDSDDPKSGERLLHSSPHCPICEFQAQGQLPVESTLPAHRLLIRPQPPVTLPIVAPQYPHPSFNPRAPPIAFAGPC